MKSRPDSARVCLQISPEGWKQEQESCQELISLLTNPHRGSIVSLFSFPTVHFSLLPHSFAPQTAGQASPPVLIGGTSLTTAQFQTESNWLALLESGAYVWSNQLRLKKMGGVRDCINKPAGQGVVMEAWGVIVDVRVGKCPHDRPHFTPQLVHA